jgi:hypothetical protein
MTPLKVLAVLVYVVVAVSVGIGMASHARKRDPELPQWARVIACSFVGLSWWIFALLLGWLAVFEWTLRRSRDLGAWIDASMSGDDRRGTP